MMANDEKQYEVFAEIRNNKINILQQGLQILDEFDFCSVVTVQGNFQSLHTVNNQSALNSLQNSQRIQQQSKQNCIMIHRYPGYSSRLKRYIVLLKIYANDQITLGLAHTFCSLISNLIIVSSEQRTFNYMLAPSQIIVQNNGMQSYMGALMGITEDTKSSNPIIENGENFGRLLQRQNISKVQLSNIYPYVNAYQIAVQIPQIQSSSLSSSRVSVNQMSNVQAFQSIVEQILQQNYGNSQVTIHGEILCEYSVILAGQFNQQNKMYPSQAQDNIQVDQDFQNYMRIIQKYNNKCKNNLGAQGHNDLPGLMQKLRLQVESEPVIQNNPHYIRKISRYMDRKQVQLSNLNEQFNDAYNLNLLQKQSSKSLQTVSNNKNITHQQVSKQVDRIVSRYNSKSRGENRHKLLTQFMQVFTPTIYSEAGLTQQVDQRINNLAVENKNLQTQIAKLKKKQGKCCAVM